MIGIGVFFAWGERADERAPSPRVAGSDDRSRGFDRRGSDRRSVDRSGFERGSQRWSRTARDDAWSGMDEDDSIDPPEIDPMPTKLDGTRSTEFEPDDIERARSASDRVREYCAGAVSEAQWVGCLSHVDESDIP